MADELARVLVERYKDRLRGLVKMIAGDRVRQSKGGTEDILQEIWKSFLSHLTKGDGPRVDDDLWTKLACFARRKALKGVRHGRARKRDLRLSVRLDSLAETFQAAPDPSLDEAIEVADEIEHVVRHLVDQDEGAEKERVQTIVALRLDGETHEDIAGKVGCSEKTVQRYLQKFREALRVRLEEEP
jgi:RNA polymerase sigma factor (sigma-70 family)